MEKSVLIEDSERENFETTNLITNIHVKYLYILFKLNIYTYVYWGI